jgi:hypothetical protein
MMFLMSASIGNAQNVTEVVDSVKSGLKSKSVKEAVSKVQDAFKAKVAEADSLVGTWVYVEPAVLSTSGNLLRKAIGNVSAGQLEKLMRRAYSNKPDIRDTVAEVVSTYHPEDAPDKKKTA